MKQKQTVRQKYVHAFLAGCGMRRVGHSYIVSKLSKSTPEQIRNDQEYHPLANFFLDPPMLIEDYSSLGLSPQGLSFLQNPHTGIWDVYDWVGMSFYPNAADIWEEMSAQDPAGNMRGGSALAQITDDWHRLTPNVSKRWLVHPAGWFDNTAPLRNEWIENGMEHCMLPQFKADGTPSDRQMHLDTPTQMCSAMWWQAVTGFKPKSGRAGVRTIGSTEYPAVTPVKGEDPLPRLAIIGWVPITEVHVVAGDPAQNPKEINTKIKETLLRLQSMALELPIFVTNA